MTQTTERTELTARIAEMKQTIAELEADGGTATLQRDMVVRYEAALAELPADEGEAPAPDRSHALHARPAAGSAASNQYGTFQVAYATPKQTAFIKGLMDRKDLSQVDPKKVDVAALREQVANTQVNKKAASAIIDTLLALPDATAPAPTPAAQGGRPATDRQKDFVRTLLAERTGNADAEAIRTALNEAKATAPLAATFVSDCITALLEIPKTEAQVEVPEGRYALPAADGHVAFYKVDRPTEGRWAGYVFVKQLIGAPGDFDEQRLDRSRSAQVLADIAAMTPAESARLFGRKHVCCSRCLSALSLVQSRATGFGSTCAERLGVPYLSRAEALKVLDEEGISTEGITDLDS